MVTRSMTGAKSTNKVAPSSESNRQSVFDQAHEASQRQHQNSQLPDLTDQLPKLSLSDLPLGKVLGEGGFATVYEVSCCNSINGVITRSTDASTKPSRFAIKLIKTEEDVSDGDLFQAAIDKATEAKLLSSIDHPNIVKLQAISACGMFHEDSFLLLDRLYDTLADRRQGWGRQMRRLDGLMGKALGERRELRKAAIWEDRLTAAYDLSSAIAYLHSCRIIHRDIKPENIGFDFNDEIKLFDFGIARELPALPTGRFHDEECVYHMTRKCGSPRYMAPEIARGELYNEKCDVFSFAVLLWEILSLRDAYGSAKIRFFKTSVWRGERVRPTIDPSWSADLQDMFAMSWIDDIEERPSMASVSSTLYKECVNVSREGGKPLALVKREKSALRTNLKEQASLSSSVPPLGSPSGALTQVSRAA